MASSGISTGTITRSSGLWLQLACVRTSSIARLRELERLVDFLAASDRSNATATIDLISGAVAVLADHPLIGRTIEGSYLRELVISRGQTGYVDLYSHEPQPDAVLILAVRHQREAGYSENTPP